MSQRNGLGMNYILALPQNWFWILVGNFNLTIFFPVERLKQQMEEKEVNLEDLGSKLKNLEREKLKLVRDLEQWNGEQSKLDTFERENRDLMQVCARGSPT